MTQYWISAIIQNDTDKRAWLCSLYDSVLTIEEAIDTIEKIRKNNTVLSVWIDTHDNNNVKNTVFHKCYVNAVGNVEKCKEN